MSSDLVLHKDELLVALNEVHLSGQAAIDLVYPFIGLTLGTLDYGRMRIDRIVGSHEYADQTSTVDQGFQREVPEYGGLRQALISCGIVGYSNWHDVARAVRAALEEERDLHRARRPLYLSVDTNLLYLRTISRLLDPPPQPHARYRRGRPAANDGVPGLPSPPTSPSSPSHPLDARDFRWVVSEMVREEVDRRIRAKYKRLDIELFKSHGYGWLAERFFNASDQPSRVAKSAFAELDWITSELRAQFVAAGPFEEDKEKRDVTITRSLRDFEKSRACEVLLLSADADMAYHARAAELSCEILHFSPTVPSSGNLTPRQCVDLLYDLALLYGALALKGTGIVLLGEWGGKTPMDWADERIMAVVDDRAAVRPALERDLASARKLASLLGSYGW